MSSNERNWQTLYETGDTGWDLGSISPPIKTFVDQLKNKSLRILIPGGGNSYESEYLFHKGFANVHVLDIASTPIENIQKRCPAFPANQLHHLDFFDMTESFDLMIEQTFFCALPPTRRPDYVKKAKELLHPNGQLAGLLFDFPLTDDGPPFGGDAPSYQALFEPQFDIQTLAPCYNSTPSRSGRELFISMFPRSQ